MIAEVVVNPLTVAHHVNILIISFLIVIKIQIIGKYYLRYKPRHKTFTAFHTFISFRIISNLSITYRRFTVIRTTIFKVESYNCHQTIYCKITLFSGWSREWVGGSQDVCVSQSVSDLKLNMYE